MTTAASTPNQADQAEVDGAPKVVLTPNEDLMIEALAARYRLAEPFWTFERRHLRTMRTLAAKGLISYEPSGVTGLPRARLSPAGVEAAIDERHVPPALDPNCRSFYFGWRTGSWRVDCTRKARHKGKHKAYWPGAKNEKVRWTDATAYDAEPERPTPKPAKSLAKAMKRKHKKNRT